MKVISVVLFATVRRDSCYEILCISVLMMIECKRIEVYLIKSGYYYTLLCVGLSTTNLLRWNNISQMLENT